MLKRKASVDTIEEFYRIVEKTRVVKLKILKAILNERKIKKQDIDFLRKALFIFESIKKKNGKYFLFTKDGEKINLRLDYEINELKKDLIYLEKGKKALLRYLSKINNSFFKEVENGFKALKDKRITTIITDRDGTINNYAGRYKSSIQSIYNAVFLTNFVSSKVKNAVVLSSAPLNELLGVSIAPKNLIVYAGSNGRELLINRNKKTYPIVAKKRELLNLLAKRIEKLTLKREYKKFLLIGSGFQHKFGQLTIARQDIDNSIDEKMSKVFLKKIKKEVKSIDPQGKNLGVMDTGLDIEITLTLSKGGKLEEFNKGSGTEFIINTLHLKTRDILVCGDTESDFEMFKITKKFNKNTQIVFVTTNKRLKVKVKRLFTKIVIVPNPDTLITILDKLSGVEKNEYQM